MTIYDTIGGRAAVGTLVNELYRRALDDPNLNGYFANTDMTLLHRHQRAFIAAALGRPGTYHGRAMGEAHAGLNITDDAFDRVATHLVSILRENGVDEEAVGHIADSLGPLRAQIVTQIVTP
jgi:hemoglobin